MVLLWGLMHRAGRKLFSEPQHRVQRGFSLVRAAGKAEAALPQAACCQTTLALANRSDLSHCLPRAFQEEYDGEGYL